MKKNSIKINENQVVNKILDLCMYHQIEESTNFIKIIECQIKFCYSQLELLEDNKPLWFQKKKLNNYFKEKEELELKLEEYYKQINEELKIIEKMKNSIND